MKPKIDLDWLLRTRVVIARCGEMDANQWWNTKGQLGAYGVKVLRRGFPRTHFFAQARSVFAVAAHRCDQVFNPPTCATFWHLSEAIEDTFDANWDRWIDSTSDWKPFFESVAELKEFDVPTALQRFNLTTAAEAAEAAVLKRSAAGKAVLLPGQFSGDQKTIALLALAFGNSSKTDLSVPYIPWATT